MCLASGKEESHLKKFNRDFDTIFTMYTGKYVPNDPKKPLHRCNFYGSREAGDKLREMLKLGASK
jgi:Angiotensin-converting enzyme